MTDRIDIKGIEVYARHGVLEEEHERAQVFLVDVTVFVDLSTAARSDDLADTIDYSELAIEVREVVGAGSHQLLETVAGHVADAIMARPLVGGTIVTIHKPNAPMDLVFEDVSVTVERSR